MPIGRFQSTPIFVKYLTFQSFQREELELLADLDTPPKNPTTLKPSAVSETKVSDDFVSVMKEDSFSDSDQVF